MMDGLLKIIGKFAAQKVSVLSSIIWKVFKSYIIRS